MKKIMITGGRGMLGRTLERELSGYELIIADRDNCDITDAIGFGKFMREHKPDTVIHCAAMTAVDDCETRIDDAYRLNAVGSKIVASSANAIGARLIAISTDYVFDGFLDRPYNEYDKADPKTMYGKSKYAGEEAVIAHCPNHVIARISWLYGFGGPSFVHTMIKLADGSRPLLKVVGDQIGNPTSTTAVARCLKEIVSRPELTGLFHMTCEGEASWYELTKEIFKLKGINQAIQECTTSEYQRLAPRPANSRLDKMNLRLHGLPPMPHWKDALAHFLAEEKF